MREIIFRGKRTFDGEWVEGDLCQFPDRVKIDTHTNGQPWRGFDVIPETVGQYTGKNDKDGRKIFDGDILAIKFFPQYVERISWKGPPDAIAAVFWDLSSFRLQAKNGIDLRYADFCDICYEHTEIIGNIHDNPEWLRNVHA